MRKAILEWGALVSIVLAAVLIWQSAALPESPPVASSQVDVSQPTVVALQKTQISLDATIAANTRPEPSRTPRPTAIPKPTEIPPTALPVTCDAIREEDRDWRKCTIHKPTAVIPHITSTPIVRECPPGNPDVYPLVCYSKPGDAGELE